MLTSTLPPIAQISPPSPPPPVATFFNVPRRYVKTSMQGGDKIPASPIDDSKPFRNLRKSSRILETRSAPTSSSTAEGTKKEKPTSPAPTSPSATRKRLSSLVEASEREEAGILAEEVPPPSATSTTAASPDYPGHVCLCQPEPKIPRPRNGKHAFISLSVEDFFPIRTVGAWFWRRQRVSFFVRQSFILYLLTTSLKHLSFIDSTTSRLSYFAILG